MVNAAAFSFERTFDYALVRKIITHPRIYTWMQSDGAPSPDEYRPPEMEEIWYVLVKDNDEILGLFMLVPTTNVCVQLHACLLPRARRRAIEIYRAGIDWIWQHSTLEKLVGFTPSYNFAAINVAKCAGLDRIGVITRSLRKFGKLQDQVIFAIGRPEEKEVCHG